MLDVSVIDDPAAAEASLQPIRARLLAELAKGPGSASSLAESTGLTRQKANYHLRALEDHGLVELVEERRKGNCTERVLQATAASFVISPAALSAVAPDPGRAPDQRSARWLVALGARLVQEVGTLIARSEEAGKPVATLGIDSEVRFASAADRAAFATELADAVNGLVAKYHAPTSTGGRGHRFVVALHPSLTPPTTTDPHQGAPAMSTPFEIARDVELPAPPADVWTAITAHPEAWQFPTGMEVPEGQAPPEGAPVATWDPPRHLVVRMDAPDGTFNSLEYLIEARDGGTARVHYVHSGILADEWADQLDAIGPHTDFYLHTLGQYLAHFAGRPCTYVGQPSFGINGPEAAGAAGAMDALRAALGIAADASVGDRVKADLGEGGPLDGEVDYLTPQFIGVRTDDALYRFFGRNHFGQVVGMSVHAFGPDVDAAAQEAALTAWLGSVYA
ncbi:MAG: helix-turn-helix domain-containing protein [Acidimicrobiales bacterium]